MQTKTVSVLAGAALAAGVCFAATATRASTFVLGNGLAHDCSVAALDGKSDGRSLEICNLAIETEALDMGDRAKTYVNRGVVKLRRSSFTASRDDFDSAIRLDETLGEAWVNRGASYIYEGRYAEGVADLDKGIALGLGEPEKAYYNRAMGREAAGDVRGAYLDYRTASNLDPEWAEPKQQLTRFAVRPR